MQNTFSEPAMRSGLGMYIGVFEVLESESAIRIAWFLPCKGDLGPTYCSIEGLIVGYPAIVSTPGFVCCVTAAQLNSTICTASPGSKGESSCAIIF